MSILYHEGNIYDRKYVFIIRAAEYDNRCVRTPFFFNIRSSEPKNFPYSTVLTYPCVFSYTHNWTILLLYSIRVF